MEESTLYIYSCLEMNRVWVRDSEKNELKTHFRSENGIQFFGWATADFALPAKLRVLHVPTGKSLFTMCTQEIYMVIRQYTDLKLPKLIEIAKAYGIEVGS